MLTGDDQSPFTNGVSLLMFCNKIERDDVKFKTVISRPARDAKTLAHQMLYYGQRRGFKIVGSRAKEQQKVNISKMSEADLIDLKNLLSLYMTGPTNYNVISRTEEFTGLLNDLLNPFEDDEILDCIGRKIYDKQKKLSLVMACTLRSNEDTHSRWNPQIISALHSLNNGANLSMWLRENRNRKEATCHTTIANTAVTIRYNSDGNAQIYINAVTKKAAIRVMGSGNFEASLARTVNHNMISGISKPSRNCIGYYNLRTRVVTQSHGDVPIIFGNRMIVYKMEKDIQRFSFEIRKKKRNSDVKIIAHIGTSRYTVYTMSKYFSITKGRRHAVGQEKAGMRSAWLINREYNQKDVKADYEQLTRMRSGLMESPPADKRTIKDFEQRILEEAGWIGRSLLIRMHSSNMLNIMSTKGGGLVITDEPDLDKIDEAMESEMTMTSKGVRDMFLGSAAGIETLLSNSIFLQEDYDDDPDLEEDELEEDYDLRNIKIDRDMILRLSDDFELDTPISIEETRIVHFGTSIHNHHRLWDGITRNTMGDSYKNLIKILLEEPEIGRTHEITRDPLLGADGIQKFFIEYVCQLLCNKVVIKERSLVGSTRRDLFRDEERSQIISILTSLN